MAGTYYKYAERDADSQVNWAEVGKGITDMLAETNRVRQEKRDAIDAATREEQNNLANAPQGQDQDLNNFTNRFAHNAMQQTIIDERLLKSGQMPLEKYTLRRQNRLDGTNTLFELSKLYQDEFKTKMEGVTSGKLQALNIFNMSSLEGMANFNNSEAVIDSLGDGRVNVGLYENKIIDGKEVRVLSKDIAPVNVWKNRILQNIPTFDVEEATSATVKNFGTRKDVLYEAASLSGAGTITELMGPDFLATNKDETTQKIVNDTNEAINYQIDSYFSNPYNLTSVLTQNTGKYNDKSFTFDKEEASKDKKKILLKINPATQMGEMDEDGPNYKAQYDEARNLIKTNMLSKMDQERSIKPTSQNQLQETAMQKAAAEAAFREKKVDETKPVSTGEIVEIRAKNGNKNILVGVSQRLQNVVNSEVNGVQNVVTDIGYNRKNGALEIRGYQVSGKESEATKGTAAGTDVTSGSNVVKKQEFLKNDINSAPLLTIMVKKIPNPNNPGYNFESVSQAKAYYKSVYDNKRKGTGTTKQIQFDANGNIIK